MSHKFGDRARRYAALRKKKVKGDGKIHKWPGRQRKEKEIQEENEVRRRFDDYERDPEVIRESNEEARKGVLEKGKELVRDKKEENDFLEASRQKHDAYQIMGIHEKSQQAARVKVLRNRDAASKQQSSNDEKEIRRRIAALPTPETDRLKQRRSSMDKGIDPDSGKDIRREAMRDYFINRERGLSSNDAAKNRDKLGWAERARLERGAEARLQGYDDDRSSRSRAAQDAADSERRAEEAEAEARAKAAHYAAFRKQQQPKFDKQEATIKKAESEDRVYIALTPRENPDQPELPGDELPGGVRSETDNERHGRLRSAWLKKNRRI